MVLHKRIEYGFSGYQVPSMPRSTRSARRNPSKKKAVDNEQCAFDLLVDVASKLLSEAGNEEHEAQKNPIKEQQPCNQIYSSKKFICRDNNDFNRNNSRNSYRNDIIRDDDEKSYGWTTPKTFRGKPSRRRLRNLWTSRNCKLHPKSRNKNLSNDGELNSVYCNRKSRFRCPESQSIYPFKKRKIYAWSSASSYDLETTYYENDTSFFPPAMFGEKVSSVEISPNSCQSKDSHVKLRIDSLNVSELFIDISPTQTVASLKRSVVEAVMSLFGAESHVDVLLPGNNVKDENKTLLQIGVSHDNYKSDALGFTLEQNPSHALNHDPLERNNSTTSIVHEGGSFKMGNLVENDHEPTSTSPFIPMEKSLELATVPLCWKSKRAKIVQRRIRRPFSAMEVEALVESVEKLGTGRWRDVKLGAFDNAKHRTYVDLKDKWKTLVHTAGISPQQRRGEAVPQQVLDRVLKVHAYWSNHP